LIELSRKYFDELNSITRGNDYNGDKRKSTARGTSVPRLFTVYNSEYGDLVQGIEKEYCFRIYKLLFVLYAILQSQLYRIKRGKIRYCLVQ
jgi:hypothetical protein